MPESNSSHDVILSPAEGGTKNPSEVKQILRSLRALRMTGNRVTRLIFYMSLFFLGCYPAARLKPPPEELTPERVLQRAASNQELITSSASLISFNFKSPQESFSGDLELFFRKPDNFAFAVKALLGPDYVSGSLSDDSLLVYFPRSKEYYKGKSVNCLTGSNAQTELSLFCLLKLLVSETKISREKANFTGVDKKNYVYEDSIESWKRRFWLDQERAYLVKSLWRPISAAEEGNGFTIEYKNFEKFDGTKLPKAVEIKSLDQKVRLKLRFLERNINASIPDKKFQIKIPEDTKPVDVNTSSN